MRFVALVAGASALISATPSAQSSPLTGTWVAELDSQHGLPTDVYVLRDGTYSCESCLPPRRYPADGQLRPVGDDPSHSEAVRIVDGRTISTRILQPDLVRVTRMQVARDGQTALYTSVDRRPGIRGRLRTVYLARRIAAGPAGSHAVSGTWQGIRYVSVPVQLRTTILKDSGEWLRYRSGTGYSYTARYGGEFVPISGPYDGSISVSVSRLDPHRVVETRRRGGETLQVRTYVVAGDGLSMEIATENPATNTIFRVRARKQRRH